MASSSDHGRGNRGGRGGRFPLKPGSASYLRAETAKETAALLPNLLSSLPTAPADSSLYQAPAPLESAASPKLSPASVRVLNQDTLDAALSLINPNDGTATIASSSTDAAQPENPASTPRALPTQKPPLVLNMASEKNPGGGWMRGTIAQEEAICYRTSLSATLHKKFYPIRNDSAIYSPHVMVLRESIASGHRLLDLNRPEALSVLSVVSVPALRRPQLATQTTPEGLSKEVYKDAKDGDTMKEKMRCILRVAGINEHRNLVLGALGCGAFQNPRDEVVRLWKEVLGEGEWKGWFENVVFAVLDSRGEGNFEAFRDGLEGTMV